MSPHALRVLVVDSNAVDRITIRRGLESYGQQVLLEEASDQLSAITAVKFRRFDVIFLDLHLPGTRGAEVLHEMIQCGVEPQSIVLMSDLFRERLIEQTTRFGVDGHVLKSSLSSRESLHAILYEAMAEPEAIAE